MSTAKRFLVIVGALLVVSVVALLFSVGSDPADDPFAGVREEPLAAVASTRDVIEPVLATETAEEVPEAAPTPRKIDEWEPSRRSVEVEAKGRFAIPEVAILMGQLLRDDGSPLSRARVAVTDSSTGIERVCETDEDGRFVCRPLHVGSAHTANVRYGGGVADHIPIEPLHVGINERTIRLESEVLLRGRVVELDTGRPVAGVTVTIGDGGARRTKSGADGSFLVHRIRNAGTTANPSSDSIQLVTWPPDSFVVGFGTQTRIPSSALMQDREWLVFVGRGGRIIGSIRTPRGDPITGVGGIALRPVGHDETLPDLGDGASRELSGAREPHGLVDDSGQFTIFAVPPRLRREFAFRLPSGSDFTSPAPYVSLDGADVTVEIVVPIRPGVLVIETLDRSGPIGAMVSWSGSEVTGQRSTDELGRLRVEGLPVGSLRVRAELLERVERPRRSKGRSTETPAHRGPSIERDVEIRADGETHVRLEATGTGSLRGRVVDREGAPVAGVRVTVRRILLAHLIARVDGEATSIPRDPPFQAFSITDSRGEFTFVALPPDPRWLVGLDDPRYRYDGREVAAGSEAIELKVIDFDAPRTEAKRER